MFKTEKLDMDTRGFIIAHHKTGQSNRAIAKELNINHSTVDYNIKNSLKLTQTSTPNESFVFYLCRTV